MYNKYLIAIFSALMILTVCACSINFSGLPDLKINIQQVKGSGYMVTEKRDVSGFNSLQFSGFGDITITQGTEESVSIEAEDNILPHIVTEVKNGALYIRFEPEGTVYIPSDGKAIRFDLKVKTLEKVDLSGAGKIFASKLQAERFAMHISGAGDIKFDDLQSKEVSTNLSGAGNINLAGKVEKQDVHLSGLGNYNSEKLEGVSVNVNVSGAGNARVWATGDLTVTISGAGSVRYAGNPRLTQHISGAGQVKSLETK